MSDNQLKELLTLLEYFFLPEEIMADLKSLVDEHINLKGMYEYNLSQIDHQRITIDSLSKNARLYKENEHELRNKNVLIQKKMDDKVHQLTEELEQIPILEEKIKLLQVQLKREVEKNYNFSESVGKLAEYKRKSILQIQELTSDNAKLTDLLLKSEQENEELHRQIEGEFEKGFKAALYQYRRKR